MDVQTVSDRRRKYSGSRLVHMRRPAFLFLNASGGSDLLSFVKVGAADVEKTGRPGILFGPMDGLQNLEA
jgi:hypothetical protein